MAIRITQTFYPKTSAAWRSWLKYNHAKKKEIWLVRYKKHTGKPTVDYQDSVDEALCFGWIDGMERRIDAERYATRFTPRQQFSSWSEGNIRRYKMLVRKRLMTAAGREAFRNKFEVRARTMLPGGQKWHRSHPFPSNPTISQRIVWHRQHEKFCACRPVPKSLLEYFRL
ncbi:MAG: hypothetical protein HYY50_05220 [Candidatus Kerfeldbacteria bacterium]|nr:hypothetical protein [Candidatus Kerfeldbacteria bacterium]